MTNTNSTMTFGAYIIYASGEFECECKTVAGVRRTVAKLRRLKLTPTVRVHAFRDGMHWNQDVDIETMIPILIPELRYSCTINPPADPAPNAGPSAVHYETAYGQTSRLSFSVLCF